VNGKGSVVRRRVLGRELRRLRERAGYTLEHALGSLILQKERDVERARLSFDRLRSDALGPEQSLALIRRTADQL
jgi:hypothetical protein